jgi:hypothetical protein
VPAPRPAQRVDVGGHHRGHHLQARAHGDGQQALRTSAAISLIATLTTSGTLPSVGDGLGDSSVVLVRAVFFW